MCRMVVQKYMNRGFPRLMHVSGFDAEPMLRINPEVAEARFSPGTNRLPKTPNSFNTETERLKWIGISHVLIGTILRET